MTSRYTGNTYNPNNLVLFGGTYANPHTGLNLGSYNNPATYYNPNNRAMFGGGYANSATAMGAWPPALENPNVLLADTLRVNPRANPNFADKFRDFNSQYGSTIVGGLEAAAGLWGAYNGMQQNKLVKQQMANSLNQWNKNYANQVASYNTRLEDRQNARVAAQGNYQQDTASYTAKNRLK